MDIFEEKKCEDCPHYHDVDMTYCEECWSRQRWSKATQEIKERLDKDE